MLHCNLKQIATKLLSAESAIAVKTIRDIIQNFPEYGVIDVFKEYPTKDVVMSILALSKLQSAVYGLSLMASSSSSSESSRKLFGARLLRRGLLKRRYSRSSRHDSLLLEDDIILKSKMNIRNEEGNDDEEEDSNHILNNIEYDLLADLAHYAIFANAAYGWKMGLLGGKLHIGDLKTLLRRTGIEERNVIETNWKSQTHLPVRMKMQ